MAVNQVPHFPFRLWPQNRVPDNDTGLTSLYILLYIRHGEQHLPSYAGYHYAMHSGGKKFFFYCFYRFGYDDFFWFDFSIRSSFFISALLRNIVEKLKMLLLLQCQQLGIGGRKLSA